MAHQAADYKMPFGKHKGRTLFQISEDDPKYLDWAVDNMRDPHVQSMLIHAVEIPDIKRRIDRAVNG